MSLPKLLWTLTGAPWWRADARAVIVGFGDYRAELEALAPADTLFTGALEHRHPTCAVPGCGATRGLHAHHIRHWEDGGPTDIDNLVLLCVRHHHVVHEGGWSVTANPDHDPGTSGYWAFAPPQRRP